jgi:hypothetical protein
MPASPVRTTSDPQRRERWNQGGRGGYSDYYPGPRPERPAGSPVARQQLHLDPDRVDDVEDRRGGLERLGPTWDQARGDATGGLRCRDARTRQDVPLSFCEGKR